MTHAISWRSAIGGVLTALVGFYGQISMANGTVYKSTGRYGEVFFSQLPPIDRQFEAVSVYYLHPPADNLAAACHYLTINLQTLQSGGSIFEMDTQGKRRQMSHEDVQTKILDVQNALRKHCHG